jgi:hypothetical protein
VIYAEIPCDSCSRRDHLIIIYLPRASNPRDGGIQASLADSPLDLRVLQNSVWLTCDDILRYYQSSIGTLIFTRLRVLLFAMDRFPRTCSE